MADTNRQWILVRRPSGPITDDCFELRESPVPEPADGQFLVQNEYLSCDPAQRGWMAVDTYIPKIPLGEVVRARGVGKVVASRHPDFAVGDLVQGSFGWQEYCVSDAGGLSGTRRLSPDLPLDLALSVFGSTGITAYFGMIEVARVKEGDVVLVSGAAGATGSIAAQIARVKGARVIGIAGGPRKKEFLLKVLKLDGAIDYKNEDVDVRIAELAPKGLDIYFDNVGGKILEAAIAHLALGARIALCGAISGYRGPKRDEGSGELSQPDPHPIDNAGIPHVRFSRPRDGMRRRPRPMDRGGKAGQSDRRCRRDREHSCGIQAAVHRRKPRKADRAAPLIAKVAWERSPGRRGVDDRSPVIPANPSFTPHLLGSNTLRAGLP